MKKIATVGVVGAGTMGSAIAQHFVMKGLPVILVDQQQRTGIAVHHGGGGEYDQLQQLIQILDR